jgi:hypothetical protein
MDYERLVTVVDSLSRVLTQALGRRTLEHGPLQRRTGRENIEPEGSHDG